MSHRTTVHRDRSISRWAVPVACGPGLVAVTCTAPDGQAVVFGVSGSVRQRVGRGFVDGFFFADLGVPCDGSTSAWAAVATPDGGKFAGGKAATVAFTFGCGTDLCSEGYAEAIVQMRRGRIG